MKVRVLLCAVVLAAACKQTQPTIDELVLATTTSTYDSGLLDAVNPGFEATHAVRIKVLAVGTGEALELGRRGVADVLLTHAPAAELELVGEGHAIDRRFLMWNDFVIVGPSTDPCAIRGSTPTEAFRRLSQTGGAFLSRGDDSGTHKKERSLLAAAGVEPGWDGYAESGQGMGNTLRICHEKQWHCLTDRGTLESAERIDLVVLVEGDSSLVNPYHLMRVNPDAHPATQVRIGTEYVEYLTSDALADQLERFGFHTTDPP